MGRDIRQEALTYLIEQAEKQGYVTFDNVMDCADANSLSIQDFDWLSSAITTRGIIVYDETPTNRINSKLEDDDYEDYAQSDYEAVYNRIIEIDPSLKDFVTEVRNIKPPQRREFSQLKYQVLEGNQHARDRMIEMHLRIALRIALQRTETYDMDIQDAVGEACVGLIIAVDKYDPDINGAFASYASMWIMQSISRRQPTRRVLMYYPVHKKESYFMAYSLLKASSFEIDSDIKNNEEAKGLLQAKLLFTDEQIEDVFEMMIPFEFMEEAFSDFFVSENDSRISENEEVEVPKELLFDARIEEQAIDKMLKKYLSTVLNTLSEREQEVLRLRYGLDDGYEKTLEEVGDKFGVTRERIRQIEAKAIRKLLHPSRSKYLKEMYWEEKI